MNKRILKPFPYLLVFGVMLLMPPCIMGQEKSASDQDIPYRLLRSDEHDRPLKVASYDISVDLPTNRQQIEQLICQVVRDKKPDSYPILSIRIWYKLDKNYAVIGLESERNKSRQFGLAYYAWDKSLRDKQASLMIERDEQGNYVEGPMILSSFDHSKDCK